MAVANLVFHFVGQKEQRFQFTELVLTIYADGLCIIMFEKANKW
jgi:hypothetical protein